MRKPINIPVHFVNKLFVYLYFNSVNLILGHHPHLNPEYPEYPENYPEYPENLEYPENPEFWIFRPIFLIFWVVFWIFRIFRIFRIFWIIFRFFRIFQIVQGVMTMDGKLQILLLNLCIIECLGCAGTQLLQQTISCLFIYILTL